VLKFANVAISALDVSIRAQMMNLLKQIQTQDKVAYLLVAHDLATARHMTDQTIIRYLGKIVELAPTRVLLDEVRHPNTKALFCAVLLARSAQLAEEMVWRKRFLPRSIRRPVAGSIRAVPWQYRAARRWNLPCGKCRRVTAWHVTRTRRQTKASYWEAMRCRRRRIKIGGNP
jgi:ABC-type oligopeptide transport system ATPase subunit